MKKGNDKPYEIEALVRDLPLDEANRLLHVWEVLGASEADQVAIDASDVTQATRQLHERIAKQRQTERQARVRIEGPRARRSTSLAWMSASIAASVVIAFALFLWWSRPVVRTAPSGAPLAFDLPDGSRVELNSGSTLRYARRLGVERVVVLSGEAFFNVRFDQRRFEVQTHDASVRVLGTQFNVRSWPDDDGDATTVSLQTGSVRLTPTNDPVGGATIAPGQTWTLGPTGAELVSEGGSSVADATAWRDGSFVYRDVPISRVLADVERRYGIRIVVSPASEAAARFSLAIRQPRSAEDVVADIAMATGLNYRERSNGFELFRDE